MKIAYDAKRFFQNRSGLGNYSRDLVRIMATAFPENEYILFNKKKTELGKEIMAMPNVHFQENKGFLARQTLLGKAAEQLQVDIFHGLSGELPLRWAKDSKVKKVVTIHDLIFERFPQYYTWMDRKIHFWKFKKAAQVADKVIAISEQTKKDIVHFLNIDPKKVEVIYQGCHPAFKRKFTPENLQTIKEKYALPDAFLLSVGTIEPRKNLLHVLKAIRGKDIPLVVVGKPQKGYFQKVQKYIQQYAIPVQFISVAQMEELAAIYQLAKVFIYISEFEGFGIPVIEALYSGTPVITSNISAMPEAGGDAALYVHPHDEKDIASKIEYLWNFTDERMRRVKIGKDFVQRFNDEHIANQWNAVYQELLCR